MPICIKGGIHRRLLLSTEGGGAIPRNIQRTGIRPEVDEHTISPDFLCDPLNVSHGYFKMFTFFPTLIMYPEIPIFVFIDRSVSHSQERMQIIISFPALAAFPVSTQRSQAHCSILQALLD